MSITADDQPTEFPLHIPARMLNEFAYCPRLFHLEWVQGQWAPNADTAEGSWQHRAVDVEKGRAPIADAVEDLREARSVLVGSDRLGLIARLDVLEGRGGSVCPVDVKKGRPPDNDLRAYEPERVQLCAGALILRENGYRCDEGELYFALTRERVRVVFDEDLVVRTLELLLQLHGAARSEEIPAPLVDSPKCPRCSLVGICLPDELNTLNERAASPARRLMPRETAAHPVYVTDQELNVGTSTGRLVMKNRDREVVQEVRLLDASQLNIYGHVQVTTGALRACFDREIPVSWFSHGGWFTGVAHGLPSKHVELRRRQVAISAQAALPIARACIVGKIRNARTLLRRNGRGVPTETLSAMQELIAKASWADSAASLLGYEGTAARLYFGQFRTMLRAGAGPDTTFDFEHRNRRPPRDPVNCLLSYVYGLLVKDLTVACNAIGFDPYLGFYHRPRFGRPALALDLAEEFRPIVGDSVVLTVINNGEVKMTDFVLRAAGVALTANGRRAVITAYERRLDQEVRHPVFGYTVTYRRVMEVQARLLAAHLLGEVDEYTAFTTR